ncbi:hypothetical protein GC096_20545 [Paenibacillus sp. LMG 31461]|uniref:Uncharacterized protein n=1 Tax=Paenibacillus plantarum TaxID=2654975 RepID=A0ABX1XD79_9BACL|nr:hypothetical protein [Paenibacillus plantarum]NOU66433.1 hypothetical protein [Paenibacillus plantarum]
MPEILCVDNLFGVAMPWSYGTSVRYFGENNELARIAEPGSAIIVKSVFFGQKKRNSALSFRIWLIQLVLDRIREPRSVTWGGWGWVAVAVAVAVASDQKHFPNLKGTRMRYRLLNK